MAIEAKEKVIDELNVKVTQWPARKAWKYKKRLGKMLSLVLSELGSGFEGGLKNASTESILDGDFDLSKLGIAMEKLFDHLTDEEMDKTLDMFFQSVWINEVQMAPEAFDGAMAGKMATTYKIMAFVVEVNYGSFLGKSGIGNIFKNLMTK